MSDKIKIKQNKSIVATVDSDDVGLKVKTLNKVPKKVDKELLKIIPEEIAFKYQMFVFDRQDNNTKVAMVNPQDIEALNVLNFLSQKNNIKFEFYAVSVRNFEKLIKNYGAAEKAVKNVVHSFKSSRDGGKKAHRQETGKEQMVIQDAPVSKLAKVVIKHAIDGRASDIHIEPTDNDYRVRYRVDGILYASLVLPKDVGMAVVAHIKILSKLKIDEKRKPQDGRFSIKDDEVGGNGNIDFRVSTFPVVGGEKMVMRVLNKDNKTFELEELGLVGKNNEIMREEISRTSGIILLTGPTGSGKSTTLYAFLKILNQTERNIVTLEDPVEYSIEGINQSQVRPEIDYTFASGLRSILRQDPDVIMVGEIRDTETAELAIHAALTGHLVFSTLHTNSAIGAIPRLIDMGIEPFLLSSSLNMVAAQRLVRKICKNCQQEAKIPKIVVAGIKKLLQKVPLEEVKKYGVESLDNLKFYEGHGCEQCGNKGYKGRLAVYEGVQIDDSMKNVIIEKNETILDAEREKQGVITIKQDGFLKALTGKTTVAEVERVSGKISVDEE